MSVEDAAPDTLVRSAPRFLVELVAWVAAPWALVGHSVALAVIAVVVLIGVPTIFGMPGAKKQSIRVAVSAPIAIALECAQAVVAVVAAVAIWPLPAAIAVAVVVVAAGVLQWRRWRWMLSRPGRSHSAGRDPVA